MSEDFVETAQWAAASGHRLRGLNTDNNKAMDSKAMDSKAMDSKAMASKDMVSKGMVSKLKATPSRDILNKATNNKVRPDIVLASV